MNKFIMKTYNDSYLYKIKLNSRDNKGDGGKANNQAIMDFIIKSHKIEDKKSDAFRGIVEEVKRQQTSSILYTVLMMDRVKICINQYEMPRAFKVFDAKYPSDGYKPYVFIDATGIIEFKNGYYVCKKIDVLCAYLFDALIYLLYRHYPQKLVNNSIIVNNALEAYVAMVHNTIEYMGLYGYAINRKKVAYASGLYFLTNMIGKELDQYTKSMAGKIAGLTPNEIRAYDIFLQEIEFTDIETFIVSIAEVFKLKGLTLEVFISKWMYYYGTGTHYASELLTSFLVLIVNAYTGSYIVGQRQVERACNDAMIKIANGIIKAGVDSFVENSAFMSESELIDREVHDRNTMELVETMKLRSNIDESKIMIDSFNDMDFVKEKISSIKEVCDRANLNNRINIYVEKSINNGIKIAYENCIDILNDYNYSNYEIGTLTEVAKSFKNTLNDKQKYYIETTINRDIDNLREYCQESTVSKEEKNLVSKTILEFLEIKKYL